MMHKARPRTFVTYRIATFDGKAECYINCYPQQKWECVRFSNDKKGIVLSWKNISLTIPKEDFEKHWKVVD